jgi:phage tail sheath protein FI
MQGVSIQLFEPEGDCYMSAALSYPCVYVEEIPSGERTIVSVPTSVTALVGRTRKGPVGGSGGITSWKDKDNVTPNKSNLAQSKIYSIAPFDLSLI